MPVAMKLTSDNIETISGALYLTSREVENEYLESLKKEPVYYVVGALPHSKLPYLIYTQSDFLDNFACIPPGIETYFVRVVQIKA